METVVVTLKLPTDLYSLVRKYAKAFIIHEQFSNSKAIENTNVLNSKLLENQKIPSREEVDAEIKRIGANFTVDRVFIYYSTHPWPDDWKAALLRWKSYNLERNTSTTPTKNDKQKCDFSNDQSFKNSVAELLAEGKVS